MRILQTQQRIHTDSGNPDIYTANHPLHGKYLPVGWIYLICLESTMKKVSIVLLIVLGLFTGCTSLGVSPSHTGEGSNPLLGSWGNVETYIYEEKEERATNILTFDDSTFVLNTVVDGEGFTEYTTEGGEYTYTDSTLILNYSFHTNAEGDTFYGDELLDDLLENRTIIFGYSLAGKGSTTLLSVEGQLFAKL